MIDKRINYRFGGGYQGSSAGPVERGSSGGDRGDRGDSAREARILQQSSPAPAPAPREERVSPIESIARIGDTSLAGKTKSEADATMESQNEVEKDAIFGPGAQLLDYDEQVSPGTIRSGIENVDQPTTIRSPLEDAREQYISEMYTKPPVTPTEDKVPDFVKQVVTPTEEPKIDIGFQEALRKQQIATDLRQKQQDPDYGQFFRPQPVVEKPKFFDTGPGKFLKNVGLGIVAPQLIAGTKLAPLYSGYRTAKTLSNVADAFGFSKPKDVMQTLTSNLTTPRGTKTIDTTPREGREEGILQAQAPENVVQASIQKFTPDQMNMIKQRYSQLQEVIDSGTYQGRQLTPEEIKMLQEKSLEIQKIMEQYLVNPKDLGLARGGIASIYG